MDKHPRVHKTLLPPPPPFLHRLFNNPVVVKRRKHIWKGKISREPSKWRVRERNKKCHRIKLVFKVSDKDVCVCLDRLVRKKHYDTRTNERTLDFVLQHPLVTRFTNRGLHEPRENIH